MKTNTIVCKNDISSDKIHVKYYIADSVATVAVFWKSLEQAEGFSYGADDLTAETIFTAPHFAGLDYQQYYTSKQLGIDDVTNTFWQLSDKKTLDLNSTMYSSAEIEPPVMWSIIVTFDGKLIGPYNKFVETYNRKSMTGRDAEIENAVILLTCYSRFKQPTSFNQCRLALSYPAATKFDCNLTADQDISNLTSADRLADLAAYQPSIAITGNNQIAAGNTQVFQLQFVDPETLAPLANYSANVYIEHTGGYVNKQRVLVTPAGANVTVRALDLDPGDQFKVKVGWRNYSGVSEINYTVI
jgi:hypothetical protein